MLLQYKYSMPTLIGRPEILALLPVHWPLCPCAVPFVLVPNLLSVCRLYIRHTICLLILISFLKLSVKLL